jgi:hypothetical protein
MTRRYRPLYRPPGYATLPAGLKWEIVEIPRDDHAWQDQRPELPMSRHPFGVIATERSLSPQEMRTFELEEV